MNRIGMMKEALDGAFETPSSMMNVRR